MAPTRTTKKLEKLCTILIYCHLLSDYVDKLLDLLFTEVFELPHGFIAELQEINVPPPLASKEDGPAKEDIAAK